MYSMSVEFSFADKINFTCCIHFFTLREIILMYVYFQTLQKFALPHIESFNYTLEEGLRLAVQVMLFY